MPEAATRRVKQETFKMEVCRNIALSAQETIFAFMFLF